MSLISNKTEKCKNKEGKYHTGLSYPAYFLSFLSFKYNLSLKHFFLKMFKQALRLSVISYSLSGNQVCPS